MHRRSGLVAAALVAVVLAGVLAVGAVPSGRSALGEAATPVGVDPAEVADLQTRVAELSTRVAELGGADEEALVGRLGGSRAGFDERYGAPIAYVGNGVVQYDLPGIGRLTATFTDDAATELTVVSPRPAARPLDEADPADWTPERAEEIAATLVPADARLAGGAVLAPDGVPLGDTTGSSEALGRAASALDAAGCPAVEAAGFRLTMTRPSEDHVSAIALAVDPAATALAPTEPQEGGRANRRAAAVATTSLGGVANVNGVRIQAFDAQADVEGARPPAPGHSFFAVEVAIENAGRRPLRLDAADFLLVDAQGREIAATCGGREPAVGPGEIGRGEVAEGWVTFQIPDDFVPARFVVLTPSARVGFDLGG